MVQPEVLKKWDLGIGEASGFQVSDIHAHSVTNFALFKFADGRYVLFSAPDYKWQETVKQQIIGEGHSVLYFHTKDSLKVEGYLKFTQQPLVDTSLAPATRVLSLTDVASEFTRVLYESEMTSEKMVIATEISNQMVKCVQEDITCVAAIGKLANHHGYTYYHSARVAAYSIALAIEMGESDNQSLEILAIGCLLHDIGKSKIDLEILNKKSALTAAEWNLMRRHPEMDGDVVAGSNLDNSALEIILHHHERLDGEGYPHKLNSGEISKEVRIASFADTFDALTTNRPYQPSCTRFEALDVIRHRFLNQLDKDCFKAMITIMQKATKTA